MKIIDASFGMKGVFVAGTVILAAMSGSAQQTPQGAQGPPAGTQPAQGAGPGQAAPEGQRGGGRGLGRGAPPVPYDDYTGFTKLWDGATFTNWNGETDVWTIEEGTLHADTTKTPGQHHIHYTGPGAIMRDFDLKVEVKLSATGANGGIQYLLFEMKVRPATYSRRPLFPHKKGSADKALDSDLGPLRRGTGAETKHMQRAPFFALGMAAFALVAPPLIAAATVTQTATQEPSGGASAADDPAAGLFVQMCVKCHDAARITAIRRTSTEWEEVLNKMIEKGATGTEKDFENVYGYLLRNFGKLYINVATPDEIATILGFSEKDAQGIVAYRKADGPFADFEAVKKVPGIDLKKLDEHKDAIAF